MSIDQKIEANYLLGSVLYNGMLYFYMNPLAYWIMDAKGYDPTYVATDSQESSFRDGIFVVDSNNAELYLKAIEQDKISLSEIVQHLPELGTELTLYFLVDFDGKRFVSAYSDVEIEKYIPHGWQGILDYPVNYLPDDVKNIWE